MREITRPTSISCQESNTAIAAVNTRPSNRKPAKSFFFMPRKSPIAPSSGDRSATMRFAAETAKP